MWCSFRIFHRPKLFAQVSSEIRQRLNKLIHSQTFKHYKFSYHKGGVTCTFFKVRRSFYLKVRRYDTAVRCNRTWFSYVQYEINEIKSSTKISAITVTRFDTFKAGPPPLDLTFWSFLTFLHHGIEKIERLLLWKFYKKIRRKSWSNVLPKLVACIGFLYKVVHKIGCLRKFDRSRGI